MAQKIWELYTNQGGSLSDGSIWYLTNGSTPGNTYGVPGPADYVYLDNTNTTSTNPVTGDQSENFTGTLSAATVEVSGPLIRLNSATIYTADLNFDNGSSIQANSSALHQMDTNNAVELYGATLALNSSTLTAFGIYEGFHTGGSFSATNGSNITFQGAPNSNPANGLIGMTVQQSAVIDRSTVNSAAALIVIGENDPTNNAVMTVQNGSTVQALYTAIGSGNGAAGTLNILGAGTAYADVGPASTTNGSGLMIVGIINTSVDTITSGTNGVTATLHVGSGATLTDNGGRIGDTAGTVGVATVDGGASWSVSAALRVGQYGTGTLNVGAGSTVKSAGPHTQGTSSISFGNYAGSTGSGNVSGAGATLDTGGDRLTVGNLGLGVLTVSAGGLVRTGASYTDTEAALSVGGSVGSTGGLVITGANSTVLALGQTVVGGNNIGSGAVAGGSGAISATLGGALYAEGNLTLFGGSAIATDATGIIDVGGTSGRAGATTVESGATLTDNGGGITGTLAGNGTVVVNGTDTVGNTTGGLTFRFGPARSVLSVSAESGGSALVGFANGDVLEFAGQNVTPTVSGNVLSVGGAAFGLYAAPAGTHYTISHDPAGNTFVTAITATDDFNADGRSDLLLQNRATGAIAIETQAGLAITGSASLGDPGPSWHVMGSADVNGDGQPDVLVQNDNGTVVDYLMQGTTIAAGHVLGTPGAAWHVRGEGDFNGDGKSDIVLQNDNGSLMVWLTDGSTVTSQVPVGSLPPGWTVEGVADLNGDGSPDLLVQNTSGEIVDYLMSGTTTTAGNDLGNPGAGWSVVGTGAYTGDGRSDIVLHNDNGATMIWDTNGTAVTAKVSLGNPGANWTGVVAGLDLNGDGQADVVEQNTTGGLVGFTLNGSEQITAGAGLTTTPGVSGTAIGNDPMLFIDGTASPAFATLAATAGADQFNFTSFVAGPHYISGFDPAQDAVALSAATFASYAAVQANEVAYQGSTFINLTPGGSGAALVIQGVTPGQLSASDFVLR